MFDAQDRDQSRLMSRYIGRPVQRELEVGQDAPFGEVRGKDGNAARQAAIGYITGHQEPDPCDQCQNAARSSSRGKPVFPDCISLTENEDPSEDNPRYLMQGGCASCFLRHGAVNCSVNQGRALVSDSNLRDTRARLERRQDPTTGVSPGGDIPSASQESRASQRQTRAQSAQAELSRPLAEVPETRRSESLASVSRRDLGGAARAITLQQGHQVLLANTTARWQQAGGRWEFQLPSNININTPEGQAMAIQQFMNSFTAINQHQQGQGVSRPAGLSRLSEASPEEAVSPAELQQATPSRPQGAGVGSSQQNPMEVRSRSGDSRSHAGDTIATPSQRHGDTVDTRSSGRRGGRPSGQQPDWERWERDIMGKGKGRDPNA
jgi:Protein of unknown function (DUF3716)